MKKFLLIGVISFFTFLNTTYAVDYKKNVYDYNINEVFNSEILANEKKDSEVKKLEKIRNSVMNTGGFYSYDISVNPILSDDKVTKVFESFDDYKKNISLYEKEYKNALFIIKLSERFKDKESLDERINFLNDDFDDFSYEISNDYEYSLKSINVVKKTLKEAEDVVNDFKSKYLEVTGGINKIRNKSLDKVILSNEVNTFDNYDDALRLKNSLVFDEEYEFDVNISKESKKIETSKENVSKVFKTLNEAEDYISTLKDNGYDVSNLKTELQSFEDSIWTTDNSVIVNPSTVDGKKFNYEHFDIALVNDFVKIDVDGNKSNVRGNIVINKVTVKNGNETKTIKMDSPSSDPNGGYYEYASLKRHDLNITNKSFVTISGNVLYNGISIPFTTSGYLSETENVCRGSGDAKGFDLKFKSVTIIENKVIIDTKLVSNYKVSGTISKIKNKDFYIVKYTKTKKGYDYEVCLNGKERSLIYILNGNINIDHKVYDYVLSGYGKGYMLYGDVLVKYVDRNGKEIAKNDYFYDRVNSSYSTNPKDLTSKGYVYTSLYTVSKDNYGINGKFINDRIVITYIYDKEKVHTVQTGVSVNNNYLISLGVSSLGLGFFIYFKRRFS
jgi:LPXTG-motif cell wall-anchored protein